MEGNLLYLQSTDLSVNRISKIPDNNIQIGVDQTTGSHNLAKLTRITELTITPVIPVGFMLYDRHTCSFFLVC